MSNNDKYLNGGRYRTDQPSNRREIHVDDMCRSYHIPSKTLKQIHSNFAGAIKEYGIIRKRNLEKKLSNKPHTKQVSKI